MAKSKANDHSKYQNWIDPNEVTPYERNAKKHDDKQIRNIVNSIKRFGWQQDTVITTDNVLVIGHGRRLAALKLGCEIGIKISLFYHGKIITPNMSRFGMGGNREKRGCIRWKTENNVMYGISKGRKEVTNIQR